MEGSVGATPGGLSALISSVSQVESEERAFEHTARIAFLRNITIEGLEPFLKHHLYKSNIRPDITFGGYGTMIQDILVEDKSSPTKVAEADLVVLSLLLEELDPSYGSPGWTSEPIYGQLQTLFELLETKTRATIAVHSFISPLYPDNGVTLAPDRSDLATQVAELNHAIGNFVRQRTARFCLTDWNRYIALAGAESALDPRGRYMWKAPFKKTFLDLYAQDLARIVGLLKGKAKKCLVLDCDNTLWGGVLGEDGIDGIALDRNEYPGKAFCDFQAGLLHLIERGVLVALCSKNNEADVLEVLDKHPACRLKRSHLAGWRINWKNKAANLSELAQELNLSLNSFVFVDDNLVECGLIQKLLPEVTVLQVPDKLHELPALIAKHGLFDSIGLTAEDRQRTRLYETDALRKSAREAFDGLDDHLLSLGTVASIHQVREAEIARVAQLTQKTNQFNLTTRRYSETDIRRFANSRESAVFTLSAEDQFGALGLVGAMILEKDGIVGRIDNLLLSCRALGRGLEDAMALHCLRTIGAEWNIERFEAEYIPTRKNAPACDFWLKVGFDPVSDNEGHRTYVCDARRARPAAPSYIRIRED